MEKKEDSPKEQGEDPTPESEHSEPTKKKKASWRKVVRKPAHHPTAAGVKAMEEHDKVHDKRDKANDAVKKALNKVAKEKTAVHLS